MKVIVSRENISRALGLVERMTSKNTALPILQNVLLKTEHGRLSCSATNLEVGIISTLGAKVDKEGQVAVPGRILCDFIRSLRGDTVTLSVQQNTLTVESGKFKTTILGFDATEYPIIPKVRANDQYTIPASLVRHMVSSVYDSIALSESRPELAGAFAQFQENSIVFAATDGFRLVEHRAPGSTEKPLSVIIPRVTMGELLRLTADVEGDIQVLVTDNQISFSHDAFEMVSRLVDGRYPDYHKVIPEKFLSKVLVRKEDLENAVKAAALFSSSISDLKVEGSEDTITLSAKNSSKGEANIAIEAAIKGEPFEVMVNYHYLLDGIKTMPTDKVVIEFTGKGSAFILRPHQETKELVYLIMPLRN